MPDQRLTTYLNNEPGVIALPIQFGGTDSTNKSDAFTRLSPGTTKGDIFVYDGSNVIRLAIGTNGYVLTSDSNQASGLKWGQSLANSNDLAETIFTITNNQSSAADVTGLLFSGSSTRSARLSVQFYINTTGAGATEMSARGEYLATYKSTAGTWDLAPLGVGGDIESTSGMPAGITLTITSSGQVQYTSTNVTGTPGTSKMTFKAETMSV